MIQICAWCEQEKQRDVQAQRLESSSEQISHGICRNIPEQLVMMIQSDHSGQVALVAGHSNTVPQIIEKLGAEPISPISENTFDNLFIVTAYKTKKAKVINLKYGEPT